MIEIGEKIRNIRKGKGLSQEELAEMAGVNLRTIQRVENGETEPRGKTLSLICDVLGVDIENLSDYGKEEDFEYLFYFHLSVLSFIVIPMGNIILPLILWLNKRDKIAGLNEIGKNVLNFQILWSVASTLAMLGYVVPKIMYQDFFIKGMIIAYLIIVILNIVLPVILALQSKRRKSVRYPDLIRVIR